MPDRKAMRDTAGTLVIDFTKPRASVPLDDPDRLTLTDFTHLVLPIDVRKPRDERKKKK